MECLLCLNRAENAIEVGCDVWLCVKCVKHIKLMNVPDDSYKEYDFGPNEKTTEDEARNSEPRIWHKL